jgi:hypothetical protein
VWLAGGGFQPGLTLGATDDYGYNITEDPVKFKGRHFRLTDVAGKVVKPLLRA